MAQSQELIYEGFLKSIKVGELVATREVNDENVKIRLQTNIETHMFVKIAVQLNSESTYVNQKLMEATSLSKVNGHVRSNVQTVKKSNYYEVNIDGDLEIIDESNLVGADVFYFEEPKNIKQVYALATGEILEVKKVKDNTYYFIHDGKKEYHRYKDGVLVEVNIEHALYSITFKLKP